MTQDGENKMKNVKFYNSTTFKLPDIKQSWPAIFWFFSKLLHLLIFTFVADGVGVVLQTSNMSRI